jgi:Flp pilus assembly protein TadD
VQIDLPARLVRGPEAESEEQGGDLPADPMLTDGTFARYRDGERLRREAAAQAAAGSHAAAASLLRRAVALRADDHRAWAALAELEERSGDEAAARAAWERVLALAPESPAAVRVAAARGAR